MPFIPPEQLARAREMDLLTYLRCCEPDELVSVGGNAYATKSHDSLKISNGEWYGGHGVLAAAVRWTT